MSPMLVVSLPVFNEEEGIEDFLLELGSHLDKYDPRFVVVNDHSTDRTGEIVHAMSRRGFPVTQITNEVNSGHGVSVLRGLRHALSMNPTHVIICDGDGQFHGEEVASLFEEMVSRPVVVAEGVRTHRDDRWFRRIVSGVTRMLVWELTGARPQDANTPLRVFPAENVARLLDAVPAECPVPNLAISALTRCGTGEVLERQVRSRPPRRSPEQKDHWGQRFRVLPSRKFVAFCWGALRAWMAVRVTVKQRRGAGFRLEPGGRDHAATRGAVADNGGET